MTDKTDDDLPEWEPLTPELVEDEAIRGDTMLRWAVVLLAFLLGCTQIAETATLVHVKSGQYMAGNGWLPPTHDVFSYTAQDRPWVNLSWLFDLAAAGVFAVGCAVGLSVIKAVLAAVIFGLVVHISRAGVSTWWGSVSAALALLACTPQFTAQPELVTLLGIAGTLWWLVRWQAEGASVRLWTLPVLFAVWSNLDDRIFLGLALLLLYAVGEAVGHLLGRRGLADRNRRKQLWTVLAVCFVAALLNPFGWNSLTAPLTLYGVEYPALRAHWGSSPPVDDLRYYCLFDPVHWKTLSHHTLAGLLLLVAAVVSFVLNRTRVKIGHVFVFAGFVGFALAAGRELAAASLVAGVLGTLNAQDWYRASFRQTYSVETSELLFSRGGRAVTVLALFAVAFLAIGGRLSGPDRRRIGVGFDHALQVHIDALRDDVKDAYDDHPFHFTIRQGDVLIWIGRRVFVDSRVAVYSGTGDADLLARHDRTRRALRAASEEVRGSGQPDVWKATFHDFQITHAIPRLAGLRPDYRTYIDLLTSDDWQLTRLGAAVAVFYRSDLKDPQLRSLDGYQDYLEAHRVDFVKEAFRTKIAKFPQPIDWARAPSFYQKYLVRRRTNRPSSVQRAHHYQAHLELHARGRLRLPAAMQAAFAYLAIRDANAALNEDSQNAEAYRILGRAYTSLGNLESLIARSFGIEFANSMRLHQTLHAYNQSLKIDPTSLATHWELFKTYLSLNKRDLALRALNAYDRQTLERTNLTDAEKEQQLAYIQVQQQLSDEVDRVTIQVDRKIQLIISSKKTPADRAAIQVDRKIQRNLDRLGIATFAYQQGCVLLALKLLEEDLAFVASNPFAQLLQARLLMEAGRSEDAFDVLGRLEGVAEGVGMVNWRTPAALVSLARADYSRAVTLWNEQAGILEDQSVGLLLRTLPLAESPRGWPLNQTRAATASLIQMPNQMAELRFHSALCHIEAGRLDEAAAVLRRILAENPETPLRCLVRFYLFQLTEELIDAYPPSDRIPVMPDMFAPEPK